MTTPQPMTSMEVRERLRQLMAFPPLHAELGDAIIATIEILTAERDEADRRAGAAERKLRRLEDSALTQHTWLGNAKSQAGYDRNVSFDRVWSETFAKAQRAEAAEAELDRLREALRPLGDLLQPHNDRGPDDLVIFAINQKPITLGDLRRARQATETQT